MTYQPFTKGKSMFKFLFLIIVLFFNSSFAKENELEKKKLAILNFKNSINRDVINEQNLRNAIYNNKPYQINDFNNFSEVEIKYLNDIFREEIVNRFADDVDIITAENMSLLLPHEIELEDCIDECDVKIGRSIGVDYTLSIEISNIRDEFKLNFRLSDTHTASLIFETTLSGKKIGEFLTEIKNEDFNLYKKIEELIPQTFIEKHNDIDAIICVNFHKNADGVICKKISFRSVIDITENYPLDCYNIWISIEKNKNVFLSLMENQPKLTGENTVIVKEMKKTSEILYKNYKQCNGYQSKKWINVYNLDVKPDNYVLNRDQIMVTYSNEINNLESCKNNYKEDRYHQSRIKNLNVDKGQINLIVRLNLISSGNVELVEISERVSDGLIFVEKEISEKDNIKKNLEECIKSKILLWKFPEFIHEKMVIKMPINI